MRTFILRARTRTYCAFFLAGILAVLIPLAPHASGASTTPSITDYIRRAGDQVVTVPNGTYTGGSVSASHPATTGPYKGWLVLVAQSPRGVVVDVSSNPLVLEADTNRVLFVGFKFVNGTVSVRGDDIVFWYTEHTYPIEEWNRQFQAAGGNINALETMPNGVPKAVWIGNNPAYRIVQRTQILGADIHDVGDDGIYVDKSMNGVVQGTKIWNVVKKSYDPEINPWIPTMRDLIHNDALQIPGAVDNFLMADSYAGQTITVGGDNASSRNLTWRNLWIAHADGVGLLFYSQNGYQVTGSMQGIRSWSNAFTQNPYDSGWDQLRVDIVDGQQVTWPASLNSSRLTVTTSGVNLNQQAPSGVTMSGGRMYDQSQALDNAENPANVWRAAHPYSSWPTLFGLPAPGTGTTGTTGTGTGTTTGTGSGTAKSPSTTTATRSGTTTPTTMWLGPPAPATTQTTTKETHKKDQAPAIAPAAAPANQARRSTQTTVSTQTVQVSAATATASPPGTASAGQDEWLPIVREDEVLPVVKEEVLPVIRTAATSENTDKLRVALVLGILALIVPGGLTKPKRRRRQ